jgi:hypothetical protein
MPQRLSEETVAAFTPCWHAVRYPTEPHEIPPQGDASLRFRSGGNLHGEEGSESLG